MTKKKEKSHPTYKLTDSPPYFEQTGSKDWTMANEDAQEGIHSIHIYPARMVPQVIRDLIALYARKGERIGDLCSGSGTVAVESLRLDYNVVCSDINPLAQLLTKVKSTYIDQSGLSEAFSEIINKYDSSITTSEEVEEVIKKIPNVEFWFKPKIIKDLIKLRKEIYSISNPDVRDFFKVCFSITVRKSSNVRTREFKLYKRSPEDLKMYFPDVRAIFSTSAKKGISGMSYLDGIKKKARILNQDARHTTITSSSLGMILTSPPYGDSSTTVAYGQFSKYPLLWLDYDLEKVRKIDHVSFGGKASGDGNLKDVLKKSKTLNNVVKLVNEKDTDRGAIITRFFRDLNDGLMEMRRVLKEDRYCIIIIGNRTVCGVRVPTIDITKELAEKGWMIGNTERKFECLEVINRHIYQKRIPYVGAPQGRTGKWERCDLMMNEGIIVLRSV
jgi:hypothetical protein